ncbi:hypothetical protein ABT112_31725 [Streptomyces sp. NPDC002055]|uniref:hypothetical protein n=1 Tax=Streptomyces sp. NPDC002055 TaxID=3154534 RepID=UPI003325555A
MSDWAVRMLRCLRSHHAAVGQHDQEHGQHLEAYDPQADPMVARWERERFQGTAEEETAAAPAVGAG